MSSKQTAFKDSVGCSFAVSGLFGNRGRCCGRTRQKQNENKANDKKAAVLQAAGLPYQAEVFLLPEQFKQVTTRIVNLEAGFATDAELDEVRAANLNP